MNTPRWPEVCAAFDELVELDAVERAARLSELAASDVELHTAVVKMLAYDEKAAQVIGDLHSAPPATTPRIDPLGLAGQQIAHFRIIDVIAVGGMGVVYRAEDLQIGREVALKLPLPELQTNAVARARFLREGRAAGRLDHPNVCQIYEVGESSGGHLYIAMPLYRGETLRQRLAREHSLPLVESLRIARAITSALIAAHEAGVTHRDLKPANVMLMDDGGVRILDFGLARAHDVTQSRTSSTIGTVSYMAPEQATGTAIDARTDLWSLGVLMYEMLSGRRPFLGEHPIAVVHAILHEEPQPIRRFASDAPWRLDALLQQLLQKSVQSRPASAQVVSAELEAIAAGASAPLALLIRTSIARAMRNRTVVFTMAVAACVPAVGTMIARIDTPTGADAPDTVAPERGTHDAQAWEFFEGARSYAERRPIDTANYRIAVGLYERALSRDSAFALARARMAVALFRLVVSRNPRDSIALNRVRAEAEMALRFAPTLPEAHLALGYHFSERREFGKAIREFEIAAAGMPTSAEPVNQLGMVYRMQGKWDEALQHYERAVAIDANVTTLLQLATTYQRMREYAAAIRIWDRLIVLEPDVLSHQLERGYLFTRWLANPDTLEATINRFPFGWDTGGAATMARIQIARYRRKPAEALSELTRSKRALVQDGFKYCSHDLLRGQILADLGDSARARASFTAAIPALRDSLASKPAARGIWAALGEAYAGAGRREQALPLARDLINVADSLTYADASAALLGAAQIYARAGAITEAISVLDRLLDRRAGREASVPILRIDPTWDPLRRDPRFEQVLRRPRVRAD